MNSFYGGKQGLTYNIVQRFDSVEAMVTAFQQGGAYTKVNYGQYVLIDPISVSRDFTNRENGLLFRRGFDYVKDYQPYAPQEDTAENWSAWLENGVGGGAIYVGQISGPMGLSPRIFLNTVEELNSYSATTYVNPSTAVFVPAVADRLEQETGQRISALEEQFKLGYVNTEQILEGKKERTTRIGLQIPYSNINISATTIDPYFTKSISHSGSSWSPSANNLIHKTNLSNALYQDLQIAVPKGVKGDSLTNFTISKNENSVPNETSFNINYAITNYDSREAGVVSTRNFPVTLQAESVDELKLIGDYLYFHTFLNKDYGSAQTIDNKNWNPLGAPGGQFHIYGRYSGNNKAAALANLYAALPYGIDRDSQDLPIESGERANKAGWVVSIEYPGQQENIVELYAYDYQARDGIQVENRWFKIADFSSMMISPDSVVLLSEEQSYKNPVEEDNNIAINGLWFLQQDLVASSENWTILNKA